MRPSRLHHLRRPNVSSLLLLLLAATTAVQPGAAAAASRNTKDVLDVVLPRDPLAIGHLIWSRQEPPPPPPPPDGGGPHDNDGPPDPLNLDATPPPPPVSGSINLQAFQEALEGIAAGPITESGDTQRRYKADGNTFPTFIEAAARTCEVQVNDCTTKANDKTANNGTQDVELSIEKCEAQRTRCLDFQSNSASVTAFPDQQKTTSTSSTTTAPMTAHDTASTLSVASSTTTAAATMASVSAAGAAPPQQPPDAGPTGTQLINLGPDPQFPMFDLLCDL